VEPLHDFLRSNTQDDLLPWSVQVEAANRFGLTYGAIEEAALKINILPTRYRRNRQSISTAQQLSLFRGKVAVIGCGGLGGYITEELARLGIGQITIVDPDVFEEHNLNRQLLSTIAELGKSKVEVTAERITEINPAVTVIPVMKVFSKENGVELLKGVNIGADALDSIPTRLQLADICGELNIPLVHGSIAGWYGQVAIQFPGEDILGKIYPRGAGKKGIESELGNLSFTAGFVASIEAAEVCKILLDEGTSLRHRMLSINLLDMEIVEVQL
jgi:molybdopterin/thiamine biosynthesis adenylyltransferase